MSILSLVQTWNDTKIKTFLKKEVGIVGLNYEQRRATINNLASETDVMINSAEFSFETHWYYYYKTKIMAIIPDLWYRASGFEGYHTAIGEQLVPSEYTQRYELTN